MTNKICDLCADCVKATESGICVAIKKPRYFWDKYGECFAFEADLTWVEKYRQDIGNYVEFRYRKPAKMAG